MQYYADRTPAGSLPRDFAALPPVFVEAYDLHADPWQLANLHPRAERDRAALLRSLRARMFAMAACSGRRCREADQAPVLAFV